MAILCHDFLSFEEIDKNYQANWFLSNNFEIEKFNDMSNRLDEQGEKANRKCNPKSWFKLNAFLQGETNISRVKNDFTCRKRWFNIKIHDNNPKLNAYLSMWCENVITNFRKKNNQMIRFNFFFRWIFVFSFSINSFIIWNALSPRWKARSC